jgi:hypothetical protein
VEVLDLFSGKLKIYLQLPWGCSVLLILVALVGGLMLYTKMLGIIVVQNLVNFLFLISVVVSITRSDKDWWLELTRDPSISQDRG